MIAEAALNPPAYADVVPNVDNFEIIQNILNETGPDAEAGQVLLIILNVLILLISFILEITCNHPKPDLVSDLI